MLRPKYVCLYAVSKWKKKAASWKSVFKYQEIEVCQAQKKQLPHNNISEQSFILKIIEVDDKWLQITTDQLHAAKSP